VRPLIDKLATPHPTEKLLRVWVPCENILPVLEPTADVTLYKDFKMHPTVGRADGYAGYVFKLCEEGERFRNESGMEGVHIPYIFAKVRSAGEIATAIETFTIQRDDFWWPQILERHKIYCDNVAPLWTTLRGDKQAYVFVVRKRVRPSYRGATTIVVRRYWSHTPWAEADLVSAPMQPNNVEYDLMVIRGVTKDCLHGAIKIPGLAGPGGAEWLYDLSDATPSGTNVEAYPEREYEETNYTTWEDHVYLATQRPLRGGYLKETYEALAPPLTDIETE
jgi:hypothetical protein